jgi:[protein-PII] uridylyltransferase
MPPNSVRFDNELAENHTVLDVDAPDQPGLLYRVTRAIASLGWDVHSARISTIGERARDAFYLTDDRGRRLVDDPAALEERFLEAYMRE